MTSTIAKAIALGTSDFAKIIHGNCFFVDKSLFIREIIENKNEVMLITRPRRWGKTLNLSMLEHFFAEMVNGQKTVGLFDRLAIARVAGGRYVQEWQGLFPVMFLSFKDVKERNCEVVLRKLYVQISQLYSDHDYLLQSVRLTANEKQLINYFIQWFGRASGVADTFDFIEEKVRFAESLRFLTKVLYKHYGSKIYFLIDEYDTPLNSAYEHGYLEELSDFMRNLLSAAFKDNSALQKGILTGILRVSKNSMLSGLNNLECYNVLDKELSEYFGFTEAEVEQIFTSQNLPMHLPQAKHWYNGYMMGNQIIYNPWSILSCLKKECDFRPYWVWTGGDSLIRKALLAGNNSNKEHFYALLREDGTITADVSENITYEQLWQEGHLWNLLLSAGYLTPIMPGQGRSACRLRVPNLEVRYLYERILKDWLERTLGLVRYHVLLQGLLSGKVEQFAQTLREYLLHAMSAHDFYRESEYHTFVLGLLSALHETHYIHSNKEYGLGRPDCVLVPKDPANSRAIVLEFKTALLPPAGKKRGSSMATSQRQAKQLAVQALAQIVMRGYGEALRQYPYVKTVLQVGVAFCQRAVAVASQLHLLDHSDAE